MKTKILIPIVILVLATIATAAEPAINKEAISKEIITVTYAKVCCIKTVYETHKGTIQIPVETEIWDQNLYPINATKIITVLHDLTDPQNPKVVKTTTKYTNKQGIIKNGYILPIYTDKRFLLVTSDASGRILDKTKFEVRLEPVQ